MNYVFFETKNDDFFKHISEVFSSNFATYIFNYIYNGLLQSNSEMLKGDNLKKEVQEAFAIHRNILTALNCRLFSAVHDCCENQQCKEEHKIVLASDQLETFGNAMVKSKITLTGNKTIIPDNRVRFNMQTVLQNFKTASIQYVEQINISSEAHPIDYKKKKYAKYNVSYIEKAIAIRNRSDTKNLVYVCAAVNSGYPAFEAKIRSPGVTIAPCDEFQKV